MRGCIFLHVELPIIRAHPLGSLVAAHLAGYREELARDWRRLDERIEGLSNEIEHLARQDPACERLD